MKKNKFVMPALTSSRKILQLIQKNSLISRADIAEHLGITRAGVTAAVNIMIQKNMIEEAGEVPNNSSSVHKGRRRVLLRINENYRFVIGAVVEEYFISIGISNLRGAVIAKKFITLSNSSTPDSILDFIKNSYKDIISENCIDEKMILGMGIGITPVMRNYMNIPASNCEPDFSHIREYLSEYISCPVICGCSVAMTAAANMDFRSDIECRSGNEVFLQCGKRYSLLVICNNSLTEEFVPYSDMIERCIVNTAPESGNGSVKSEITHSAITDKVKKIYSAENTPYLYKITDGRKTDVTIHKIAEAAENNDIKVAEIYKQSLEMLGILINNLVCTNYANRIVLHNMNVINENNIDTLKKIIEKNYGKDIAEKVVLSGINAENSFLGGCAYAIRKLFYGM